MKFKENGIMTPRLALVAITSESLRSEGSGDGLLGTITNAHVPLEWPPEHWEPHVFELLLKRIADAPTEVGWHRYVALRHADKSRTLIGTLGGFRKAERSGDCEVGYSMLQDFQGKGYATEGMKALIDWALARSSLKTISAQTFPSLPKSIRVMEKCGMKYVGAGDEEGSVRYQWQRHD